MIDNKKIFTYGDKFISLEKAFNYDGSPVIRVVTNIYDIEEEFDIGAFSIESRDETFGKMNSARAKEMVCGLLDYFTEREQELNNELQIVH